MIKNVVFDISNVLAPFRFKEFLIEKKFDGDMIKRISKASVMTPYWEIFERGKLSQEEVIAAFVSCDPAIEKELHIAFDDITGIMGSYDYTESWINGLKKAGYKVYCITNFTPAGYMHCYDSISFIEKMDGCVFSFKEGTVKPEHSIFQLLLDRYNLKADECVFIDDTECNVVSAKEIGYAGIVFKNYEDTVSELEKMGIVAI